jgi:hypothetical protein
MAEEMAKCEERGKDEASAWFELFSGEAEQRDHQDSAQNFKPDKVAN